jgi:hypothetical protein
MIGCYSHAGRDSWEKVSLVSGVRWTWTSVPQLRAKMAPRARTAWQNLRAGVRRATAEMCAKCGSTIANFRSAIRMIQLQFNANIPVLIIVVSNLKGQSHEKVGEIRVEGDSLGPN